MDSLIAALLEAKARRRRELASLPIEKKLEIVLQLQRSVAEIRRSTGRPGPEPWKIVVQPMSQPGPPKTTV